jgi:hypothetical protein
MALPARANDWRPPSGMRKAFRLPQNVALADEILRLSQNCCAFTPKLPTDAGWYARAAFVTIWDV